MERTLVHNTSRSWEKQFNFHRRDFLKTATFIIFKNFTCGLSVKWGLVLVLNSEKLGNQTGLLQPWAWALESPLLVLNFFCIFEKSGMNEATDLVVSQLWGSTTATISAHVPDLHMWPSAGQGPISSSPKQWKSDGCVKIYNSPLTKSTREKNREGTAI